jgi:AmiR/NasT family two-component response regulator
MNGGAGNGAPHLPTHGRGGLQPTRILLVNMAPMLLEIVRGVLGAEADLEVVGELAGVASVREAMDEREADVVVAGAEQLELPEMWLELIRERPKVTIVGLLARGRQGAVVRPFAQLSLENLLDAIRRGTRRA